MVEKDKVLAAIELKFKGKSITKTYKENLATKWAAKIDNDTEIDNYINDREEDVLEAASEADRRVTESKKPTPAPEPTPEPTPDPSPTPAADIPEYLKTFMENQTKIIEGLTGKISGLEQKTIAERFKSDPRVKHLPEAVFKGRIPATEAEFESAITELSTDYATVKFGNDKPGGTFQPAGGKKEASKEEIAAITANMKI